MKKITLQILTLAICAMPLHAQDKPFMDRDIFESMKISFDNLRAMGVR